MEVQCRLQGGSPDDTAAGHRIGRLGFPVDLSFLHSVSPPVPVCSGVTEVSMRKEGKEGNFRLPFYHLACCQTWTHIIRDTSATSPSRPCQWTR